MGNEIDDIDFTKDTTEVKVHHIPAKAKLGDLVEVCQTVSHMEEDGASTHEHLLTIEELGLLVRCCIFEASPSTPALDEIGDFRMEELVNTRRKGKPNWRVKLETYYGSHIWHTFEKFKEVK